MKRSRVRASLTTGATCAAASVSSRISSSLKTLGVDGLHHEDALQHAAVNQWNAEEGLVSIFAGFA